MNATALLPMMELLRFAVILVLPASLSSLQYQFQIPISLLDCWIVGFCWTVFVRWTTPRCSR